MDEPLFLKVRPGDAVLYEKDQIGKVLNFVDGKDVIGLLPTGYGKSMCYLVPPLITKKVIFIISPLISLMDDQKEKLLPLTSKVVPPELSLTDSGLGHICITDSFSLALFSKIFETLLT